MVDGDVVRLGIKENLMRLKGGRIEKIREKQDLPVGWQVRMSVDQ